MIVLKQLSSLQLIFALIREVNEVRLVLLMLIQHVVWDEGVLHWLTGEQLIDARSVLSVLNFRLERHSVLHSLHLGPVHALKERMLHNFLSVTV